MRSDGDKTCPRDAGFTLVELVVVIVILGILAGIGYVGYGGYIKYAQRAADDEYIGAVNEALAAACQESGVDHTKLSGGSATVSFRDSSNSVEETKLLSVGLPKLNDNQERNNSKKQSVKDSFEDYFGSKQGNKDMVLKYYSAKDIIFVGNGELFVAYGDSESAFDTIWQQSSFKNDSERLQKDLEALHDFIGASTQIPDNVNIRDAINELNNFDGFNLTDDQSADIISYFSDVLKFKDTDALGKEQLGNGISAYIAHRTAELAADPSSRAALLDNLRSTTDYTQYSDQIVEVPMQLAALESYYNSGNASEGFKERFNELMAGAATNRAGLNGLLKLEEQGFSIFHGYQKEDGTWVSPDKNELEKFQAYKNSAQFDTDMNAYFDIMQKGSQSVEAQAADGSLDASSESLLDSMFGFLSSNP